MRVVNTVLFASLILAGLPVGGSRALAQCEAVLVPGFSSSDCIVKDTEIGRLRERWLNGDLRERLIELLKTSKQLSPEVLYENGIPTLSASECSQSAGMADLRGIDLRGRHERLDLSEVSLNRVDLRFSTFHSVDLSGAFLYGANLSSSSLFDIVLDGADLRCSVLDDTLMRQLQGRGADLSASTARNARILGGSSFSEALFADSNWTNASITDTDFLAHTSFRDANLSGSVIRSSTFTEVSFGRADLSRSRFIDSNFLKVDFAQAEISNLTVVESCFFDVSFNGSLAVESANLGSSSVNFLELADIPPSSLGIRYVTWDSESQDEVCQRGSSVAGRRVKVRARNDKEEVGGRISRLADLRGYYRSEGGFNSREARSFEYRLAEAKRTSYWLEGRYALWSLLTLPYLGHRHWTSPTLLLWWAVALIILFGVIIYLFLAKEEIVVRESRRQYFLLAKSCLGMSIIWFLGFVGAIVDIGGPLQRLGFELDTNREKSVRWLLLIEAAVGAIWLFMVSSVAIERIVLP